MNPALMPRPVHREVVIDPAFPDYQIQRVVPDTGRKILGGEVNIVSRNRYSKIPVWDRPPGALDALAMIEQKGGTPKRIICLAKDWTPVVSSTGKSPESKMLATVSEFRWVPGHPGKACGTKPVKGGIDFYVWWVLNGEVEWKVFIASENKDFGWKGEGGLDRAGRFTAFSTIVPSPHVSGAAKDYLVIVDVERQKVGPRSDVSFAIKAFPPVKGKGAVGNCGISDSGLFAEIKISGEEQNGFLFDVDQTSLVCTPRKLRLEALRMGSAKAQGQLGADYGLIPWLSHPRFATDTHNRDVVVGGGRGWEKSNKDRAIGKKFGNMLMIDCKTGLHAHVIPGSDNAGGQSVASLQHSGCDAPGWCTITTELDPPAWGAGEVWRVPLDGSKKIQRLCVHRSNERDVKNGGGGYPAEAQATSSPDGTQTMYGSNWMEHADPKGPGLGDVKAYVVSRK